MPHLPRNGVRPQQHGPEHRQKRRSGRAQIKPENNCRRRKSSYVKRMSAASYAGSYYETLDRINDPAGLTHCERSTSPIFAISLQRGF